MVERSTWNDFLGTFEIRGVEVTSVSFTSSLKGSVTTKDLSSSENKVIFDLLKQNIVCCRAVMVLTRSPDAFYAVAECTG